MIDAKKPKTKIGDAAQSHLKKSAGAVRSLVSSPLVNVIALACLIVAVFAGVRIFSANRNGAQVKFIERGTLDEETSSDAPARSYSAPEIFRGEVYDTTVRLRETGALGMAMSLAVFAEYAERGSIPPNLETVLSSVEKRGLLPPEMTVKSGEIASPSSVFSIRYQSQPQLAFEILSRPKQTGAKSPALLLRFPLASLDKRTITYFQSPATNNYSLPEPFAPLERSVAAGWRIEQWRGEILPMTENAKQNLETEKRLLSEAGMTR